MNQRNEGECIMLNM